MITGSVAIPAGEIVGVYEALGASPAAYTVVLTLESGPGVRLLQDESQSDLCSGPLMVWEPWCMGTTAPCADEMTHDFPVTSAETEIWLAAEADAVVSVALIPL